MFREFSRSRSQKKEEFYLNLKEDIDQIVSFYTQSEKCHNHTQGYVKISAQQIRGKLLSKGYQAKSFCERSINNLLNRLGYTLKKVQKCKPLKKIQETDLIFENVFAHHQKSKDQTNILRISIDTKDKVKIGALSRKGYNRSGQLVCANDKDQHWDTQLVPLGILEVNSGIGTIIFGTSKETSDFIADGLELWYNGRTEIREYDVIQIELDCGPHQSGRRM